MLERTLPACAVALIPLALAACMSTGQGERYAVMREDLLRIQTQDSVRADEDSFAGRPVLLREALIASVLERNPGLEAARAAWQAELARYPQDIALEDPRLGYNVRPWSFGSSDVEASYELGLSQPIPFPGKLALRGERALASADAMRSDLDTERVKLAALASNLFDELWLTERALETNAQHQALLEEAHRIALSRYTAGTGSQQDVLAAEAEQGMLSHRERELTSGRRVIEERINTLLHRAPELEVPAPPRELEAGSSADLDEPALVAEALENHPELRALTAKVRAREAEVALARREFLPDFSLRAGYETTWQEDALKPVVGVELNVPLQLGRRRAALEEAEARLTREKSRVRGLEDRVRLDVASAVERLRESQHLVEIAERQRLPPARDRVVGAQAGFVSGQVTFLELVDAERALLAAEQDEFEARASRSVRRAALARALGEVTGIEEVHP